MLARPLLLALALVGGCTPRERAEAASADPLAVALAEHRYPRTTSVVVLSGDDVVVEQYASGSDAESRHDVRSVGKSITALAVGVAIAEGKLPSVDTPAFAYLEHLRPFAHDGPLKDGITIADLLTMSSALDCDDDDPASPGNEENMYPRHAWARWAVDLPVDPEYARDATGRGRWSYCTAGVFLLGQILERATGEPVDRYIETRLFEPLGIDAQWARSPTGEVQTGGQLRFRARDLARIGRLVQRRGQWQGPQLVPAAWIDEVLTVRRIPGIGRVPAAEDGYGYLFWRRGWSTPCGRSIAWYMSGNGGNHVVLFDDLDAVVVVTTVNYNTRGMHDQTVRLVEEQVLPRLACRGK